ncbi:MAG: Rieske 2Fe-2S domain-containing protein [Rhodospirillaceae bacterium]|jgi:glutamate synthase domain-containing protein 2/nitrite reductase/ring-hydroxylating ferredoxin subunit|nr:Rieske 2Fe-2S domain-containing protein [Rhodospirillaceae bacterium]MBT3931341.1 Rieske 2Fe-2S domain-containing protein [Rhodospirillaceae bacterium]MBT4771712.1 Rieske 2Fe-2S domain-containing protein [Rhodospirillaceae bacterium]MBT5357894.1 Rieske 2Fe-2S domain-containing protein [Rhodospirillaceae bacterium]MBT5768081.1 Rieske 2Fe-2S domain-containing protein [Rhodospirillaceae bacterium]
MNKTAIAQWDDLPDRQPAYALVGGVDLVVVRYDENVSVLYGRCLHRGALLADGSIQGEDLICGLHGWDFRYDTGISAYANSERLEKFSAWIEDGEVLVDADEIAAWEADNPQPYDRDNYQGLYQDPHGAPEEPFVGRIQEYAANGLEKTGHHGLVSAMGVPRDQLPTWEDIQFVTGQLDTPPLLDETHVGTDVTIGPGAKRPLKLDIPLFVSDMSFGALSEPAKVALSRGAELAGTGICSGEGGMLPEEQEENSRYFYELASGRFGFSMEKLANVQAFHFKGGQGAKTGTGGHLPGDKVKGKIAAVRGLEEGTAAISPARFPEWTERAQFRDFAEDVRAATGGIPIGFKLSAQHIEKDIDAALDIGCDYIILDGRGGGTGAAPLIFRDNISVPTIPALARARRHLDQADRKDVTLVITGGLRTPADFAKALALGADAIAVSNAALQAIGCLGMRACHSNNCPVGIATQQPHLVSRLIVDESAQRLARFFGAAVELIEILARACGHEHISEFTVDDLTTWKKEMTELSGIAYGGVG